MTQTARDVTVDTDLYQAIFSSQGGALKKLVLKKYTDVAGPKGKPIALLDETNPTRFTFRNEFRGFPIDGNAVFAASADALQVKARFDFEPNQDRSLVFEVKKPSVDRFWYTSGADCARPAKFPILNGFVTLELRLLAIVLLREPKEAVASVPTEATAREKR